MNTAELHNEVREVNLAYLMLAQHLVRRDRDTAAFRLGIGNDLADLLERLTPGQVLRMASSPMLLCRFRFEDRMLAELLCDHEREAGMSRLHAAILAAGQPVETLA
ncbi:MAG TPA: flagellar transcriptional regulator FlhD [Rhodocyclaceae bacterium]|nr:MAG: flagellar transcriptional regulator FlhD [Betaproteobacteria bacterium CG2_30_68_42]PIV72141.1 MAG: flagellar transcriptional regulator FlhD [Rhodocyclales bacterium CG17_big_fil_post_rev_8_21_14_2_50_68_7]PIX75576.1 MAG: flagellar transcriptional regulator FlhD [Rhodocyclales bacterium CG_4_10_14_3_um_filter_68_10]PJA58179.1 MAG: flagellar transcriptional regulator FlhD [Rhodocyclales bacterium CG_4_9_14_3_um_filter_68_10]HCX33234.1 flagellar transcriptional regulator FlhD [Rhodocyclac